MMLKDRLLEESDKAEVNVCERCGLLSYYDVEATEIYLQSVRRKGKDFIGSYRICI